MPRRLLQGFQDGHQYKGLPTAFRYEYDLTVETHGEVT
jgi:hypothetical protein